MSEAPVSRPCVYVHEHSCLTLLAFCLPIKPVIISHKLALAHACALNSARSAPGRPCGGFRMSTVEAGGNKKVKKTGLCAQSLVHRVFVSHFSRLGKSVRRCERI